MFQIDKEAFKTENSRGNWETFRPEARWVIDHWRLDYNDHRGHSALNYQIPAA
ncbi:MAG: hypothetical protein CMJ81_22840 [Planctomycetaceae bacterium]|nr:hypothetical protein [Planctomycetaceae bacterium]